MMKVEHHIGRLVEVRLGSPFPVNEALRFVDASKKITEQMAQAGEGGPVPSRQAKMVSCCDLRALDVIPIESSDIIIEMMMSDNPHIERTALLLPAKRAILQIQIERMLRRADNANRQIFTDVSALERWLGEVLTREERWQVSMFLSEGKPRGGAPNANGSSRPR